MIFLEFEKKGSYFCNYIITVSSTPSMSTITQHRKQSSKKQMILLSLINQEKKSLKIIHSPGKGIEVLVSWSLRIEDLYRYKIMLNVKLLFIT